VKKLVGLHICQRIVERLGCLKGCLEYLGRKISFPWLYGGTGHAFIISLDPGVDVSSPDSWNTQVMYDLTPNLGFVVDGLFAWKPDAGEAFPERQREAWNYVRERIDRGIPCYGFELKAYYGGFWVITGYDDVGYYYSGWEEGGPTPWDVLGELFVPALEVRSVELCDPAPDDVVVRDALAMAVRHAENLPGWIDPGAHAGPAAFEYWASALESGEAKRDDHTYNVQLWLECREMAVAFLGEVKQRLPGRCDDMCDEAASHYADVCDRFRALIELHPERERPEQDWKSTFSSTDAAAIVRQAGEADLKGLECLRGIQSTI